MKDLFLPKATPPTPVSDALPQVLWSSASSMTLNSTQSVLRADILWGAGLMVIFSLLAPVQDTLVKLATDHVSSGVIAFSRFFIQALILVPLVALRWGPSRLWPQRAPHLHALRGVLMATLTVMFTIALESMYVADAIAIFFVEPMIVTLLGGLILREQVGWRRYLACAVGFVGALLVIQPSFEELGWVAFLPLGVALLFSIYLILTRQLAQHEEPVAMQAYTGVTGLVFLGAILAVLDPMGSETFALTPPSPYALMLLGGMGLIATFNHLLLVQAFRRAPASVLAPIQYLEIVTGVLLGWMIWAYVPNALKWAGIAIIVASGLYIVWRESRRSRAAPKPPARQ